jgi:prepilin-type processing-associated H-X9-DG protein
MLRRGMTLIDWMVATAVVAILALVAAYAVLEAREVARRSWCANNLTQLGLAAQNYTSSMDVFPPTAAQGIGANDFSMKVRVIAFLEASPFYYGLNQGALSTAPENWTCLGTLVSCYICPSDQNIPCGFEPHASVFGASHQLGYASYPNNIGTFFRNNGGKFDGPAYTLGDPSLGPPMTAALITDGTANTALFSEWVRGRNGSTAKGMFQVYSASVTFPTTNGTYPLDSLLLAACRSSTVLDRTLGDHKGQLWLRDNCGEGGGYSHIMPPNQQACLFRGDRLDPFHTMIGASSNHPGGVNVGFCDSSVKFISDTINPGVWRALATYAGDQATDTMNY